MAEFQWWLLIVGLVAGGGLVAVVMTDGRRREEDVGDLERRAEATWIAERLSRRKRTIDPSTVAAVLQAHREYLTLPPPDQLVVLGEDGGYVDAEARPAAKPLDDLDRDPDHIPDQVRDDRRRSADEDLART
jgi:hypothetical protein